MNIYTWNRLVGALVGRIIGGLLRRESRQCLFSSWSQGRRRPPLSPWPMSPCNGESAWNKSMTGWSHRSVGDGCEACNWARAADAWDRSATTPRRHVSPMRAWQAAPLSAPKRPSASARVGWQVTKSGRGQVIPSQKLLFFSFSYLCFLSNFEHSTQIQTPV
jgi:hypothetical protein